MSKVTIDDVLESIDSWTVLDLNKLVKGIEDKYGVSAAAPMAVAAVAAPASGGGAAAAAEEKTEFAMDVLDQGFSGDGATAKSSSTTQKGTNTPATLSAAIANFEGLSSQDDVDVLGLLVAPPDPVGDVGPNHYVEMVSLTFAVYDKSGNRLLGPLPIGSLWPGFAVPDCSDPSGDPIVVHDQLEDRWILSQFSTRCMDDPNGLPAS